jgi:hypothetical protein
MIDKVNVDKDPALTDLRARYLARARFFLQRYRMNVKERGGRLQIEGVHGA